MIQSGPLECALLAEVLGLCVDQSYPINLQEARQKLLDTYTIEEAQVSKAGPHLLSIDYRLRKPLAIVGDFTNTAIDETGLFFH